MSGTPLPPDDFSHPAEGIALTCLALSLLIIWGMAAYLRSRR